jgi:hypothetical protein
MWLYNLISVVDVKVPERTFGDSGRSVHGHGSIMKKLVFSVSPPKYRGADIHPKHVEQSQFAHHNTLKTWF